MICLHLAAKVQKCPLKDPKALAKMAGVPKIRYANLIGTVEVQILGETKVPTVEEICVQLSCSQLRMKALNVLTNYKKSFLDALNPSRRAGMNFEKALYVAGCVGAAAKMEKMKVDRNALVDFSGVSRTEFDRVVSEIIEGKA